jgi:hypothetical protein
MSDYILKLISDLTEAIDAKDAAAFAAFLTDDAIFRIGNQPAVRGRNSIALYCTDFFAMLASNKHTLVSAFESNQEIAWQGVVTYVRLDGTTVVLPFCNILRLDAADGKICDYLVYIDNSPLFTAAK